MARVGSYSAHKTKHQDSGVDEISVASLSGVLADGQLGSKLKSETRDMTAASGDVAYTGYGFQPIALIIFTSTHEALSIASWGFGDVNLSEMCTYRPTGSTTVFVSASNIIYADETGGKSQIAVLKTLDADGFTLTWTKAGDVSAGTLTILVLALR